MNPLRKKLELVPGVRYKGYAMLNEFGQIQFDPENKGAHEGQKKIVVEKDNYSVSQTRKFVIFHFKLPIGGQVKDRMRALLDVMNDFINIIRTYDF